jgi:HNH endonuclease
MTRPIPPETEQGLREQDPDLEAIDDPWAPTEALRVRLDKVLGEGGEVCWYCGSEGPGLIVEHRTPRSRGGSHRVGNLCWACRRCNGWKSSRTVEEFRRCFTGNVEFWGERPGNEHLSRHLVEEPPYRQDRTTRWEENAAAMLGP